MMSLSHAREFLDDAAQRFCHMSFDNLLPYANRSTGEPHVFEYTVEGEIVYINLTASLLGRLRKRVGVELVLSRVGEQWSEVPSAYFERFRSGKLVYYPP